MVARQLNLLPWRGNKHCALFFSRPLVFHTHCIIRDLTQQRLNSLNTEAMTHITYNNSITSWTRTWERWKTFLSRKAFQLFSSVILLGCQEFWQCKPGLVFNLQIWHHRKLKRYTTAARQCITPQIWPQSCLEHKNVGVNSHTHNSHPPPPPPHCILTFKSLPHVYTVLFAVSPRIPQLAINHTDPKHQVKLYFLKLLC